MQKKIYEGREKTTEGFKNEVFPVHYDKAYEHRMKFEREEERKEEKEIKNIRNENGVIDCGKFMRTIGVKERKINREPVKKYFFNDDLRNLLKNLKKSKNNLKRNNIQVDLIDSGLKDLKEQITNMSEEEKKIEKPNEIANIVEDILEFNRQQQGQGLKILTPNPITLAQ